MLLNEGFEVLEEGVVIMEDDRVYYDCHVHLRRAILIVEDCVVAISSFEAIRLHDFRPVAHPSTVSLRVAVQMVQKLQVQVFVVLVWETWKRA